MTGTTSCKPRIYRLNIPSRGYRWVWHCPAHNRSRSEFIRWTTALDAAHRHVEGHAATERLHRVDQHRRWRSNRAGADT